MARFPRLREALLALAPTDKERAQLLGVTQRTITSYKAGRWPDALMRVGRHLPLLDAYCADARETFHSDQPPAST